MSICPRCDGEGFGDNYTGNCPRCGGGGKLADVTNPPLIPWDQVAKGPVWFRPKGSGGTHWYAGLRFGQTLLDGTGPVCAIEMEFTPAEQQPGEWAALKAELKVTDELLAERERVLRAIPECPQHGPCVPHALEWIEKATRLRDGLAALEQEMRLPVEPDAFSGLPITREASAGFTALMNYVTDRLAALREGQ